MVGTMIMAEQAGNFEWAADLMDFSVISSSISFL